MKLEDLDVTPDDANDVAGNATHTVDMPSPAAPMAVARELEKHHREEGGLTLRHWRGCWMRWDRSMWIEDEERRLRAWLYRQLEHAEYLTVTGKDKTETWMPWNPGRKKIADVLDAIAGTTLLPETVDAPSWLSRRRDDPPANEIVACANGLLHVTTRKLYDLTPRYFNVVSVPFNYDPAAPDPVEWLAFLAKLWPNDPESIATLQEFFGYVLSGRTDLQKILLMIGPTRSGKGTIARILAALMGRGNAAGPTLASLATNFGLAPLLGKPLAIVSDARVGRDANQVVEQLLRISGEDMITVDRKFKDAWTGKLPTRFVMISNELPRFGDASGAIANRFIILMQTVSWLGKEDPALTGKLMAELSGIMRWAMDGRDRLTTAGKFTIPASSDAAIVALGDLVSPMAAFVRDGCDRGPAYEVQVAGLFEQWRTWCADNGREKPGTVQSFGRDLLAVVPGIKVVQHDLPHARGIRHYSGIKIKDYAPESTAHSDNARVLSRVASDSTRDDTRANALWAVPKTCTKCGEPLDAWLVDAGDTTHPSCGGQS